MRKQLILALLPFMLGACSSPQSASGDASSSGTQQVSADTEEASSDTQRTSFEPSASSSTPPSSSEEIQSYAMEVDHYAPEAAGLEKDEVKYIWGDCHFPERLLKGVELPLLVPGDELRVLYTGIWEKADTAPAYFSIVDGELIGWEYHLGRVERVRVTEGKIEAPEAAIAGMDYPSQAEGPADGKGIVHLVDASEIEEGYLVYSYSEPTLARALLTYDPRA